CMCCNYVTFRQYVESATTTIDKITKIDEIIDKLLLSNLDALDGSVPNVEELQMNDGQMVVRTRFRSSTELNNVIKGLEQTKKRYMNKLNGHVTVLRPMRKRC